MARGVSKDTQAMVNEVFNQIKQYGLNEERAYFLQKCVQCAIKEKDIPYAMRVSKMAKNMVYKVIKAELDCDFWIVAETCRANNVSFEWVNIMWEFIRLEAPYLLDSFWLYIEKYKPAKDQMYLPRRKTLKAVVDKLQALEDDKLDELFVHMPPRCGKTICMTYGAAWHCARNPNSSNLYATYKESLGGAFLDGMIEIYTDPTYPINDIFPNLKVARTDAKNHKLDLNCKRKYWTISGKGLESGLNGEYDASGWLIVDDIIEGIQDAMNPEILKRRQTIFDNNLMSRKKEKCKIIYNGTIWSLHDIFSNRLDFIQSNEMAKDIRYDVLKLPALNENDESNFDYDYGVGYSTKYFLMTREKFIEEEDVSSWSAQYQQEPIERDGAVFAPASMKYYNGMLPKEEPLKVVAACDVALGGKDYLSCPLAYVYEDGSVYIHDVVFDNSEKNITQPQILDMFKKNCVTSAFFEANQGGEGYKDDIDRLLKEDKEFNSGKGIVLTSAYAPTNMRKEQRIWDNAPNIREFYFRDTSCRSLQYRKFMQNIYSFTINGKNKFDDAPDSLATLCDYIYKGSGVKVARVMRNPFS